MCTLNAQLVKTFVIENEKIKTILTPLNLYHMNTSDIKVIKSLMNEINATQWLRNNIEEILKQPKVLGIFANQIINALKIGVEFKNGCLNIGNLAPMQSGKSGTIYFLCNYVLIDMGFLKECEHVLFVTSMTDTDLYDQNQVNLEQDPFE